MSGACEPIEVEIEKKLRRYREASSTEEQFRIERELIGRVSWLKHRLEEEVEKQRWIPVSERLPEYGHAVFILTTLSVVPKIATHDPTPPPQWRATDGMYYRDISYSVVTHWMDYLPFIPTPPTE